MVTLRHEKFFWIVNAALILLLSTFLILGQQVGGVWPLPGRLSVLSFVIVALLSSSFPITLRVVRIKGRKALEAYLLPPFVLFILIALPFLVSVIVFIEGIIGLRSIFLTIFITALTFTFWFNFMTVPLAVYHKIKETEPSKAPYYPTVSIIIPAYNEEKVLARTIESVLEAEYPAKEVIVVDDGSKDSTYAVAAKYIPKGVKVYRRPKNGGKYSALNYGIRFAKGEIVVTVDADTIISRNAIVEIVKRFQDPDVASVAGDIRVLNRRNLLTRCQALEYILGINIFRRAFDVFGVVMVVPGPLGAHRRAVIEAGGLYDGDTLTEDFDITVKSLKAGKIVQASSEAMAYTEAPETLRDLIKQRLRWYRGNFQTMLKHRDAFTNPRYGFLTQLGFPYLLTMIILLPVLSMLVIAGAIITTLQGYWLDVAYSFMLFTMLQTLLSLLALQLSDEDLSLAAYSPLFVVGYKQLIDFLTSKSIFDVLLRRKVTWTSVRRIGT